MNRYIANSNNVDVRYDGKRVFKTTRYPSIPHYDNDIYVIVTAADFLDTLARKFYNDETLWWVIAQANGLKGSMKPKNGTQLRIPGNISDVIARFVSENS